MRCGGCGAQCDPDSKFCQTCGNSLAVEAKIPVKANSSAHGGVSPINDVDSAAQDTIDLPLPQFNEANFRRQLGDDNPSWTNQHIDQSDEQLATDDVGENQISDRQHKLRTRLLATLAVVLFLTLALGGLFAYSEINVRDKTISESQAAITDLTDANIAFQGRVDELTSERDTLTEERNNLVGERDGLVGERDALTSERNDLQSKVSEMEGTVADQRKTITDQESQLNQAREEGSQQQTRADTAEAIGYILAEVILLDDEIHREWFAFMDHVTTMNRANNNRDFIGFDIAYQNAEESAARLDALFYERDQILAQLQ